MTNSRRRACPPTLLKEQTIAHTSPPPRWGGGLFYSPPSPSAHGGIVLGFFGPQKPSPPHGGEAKYTPPPRFLPWGGSEMYSPLTVSPMGGKWKKLLPPHLGGEFFELPQFAMGGKYKQKFLKDPKIVINRLYKLTKFSRLRRFKINVNPL